MGIRMTNIATPMPQLRAKFTSKLGIPLSGCKVYTYEPNSDILKKTWIDIDKTVENTNPILLDAAGEADIYLDGLYRIVVKDRLGFVVYDVENTGRYIGLDASFVVDGDNNQHQINEEQKAQHRGRIAILDFPKTGEYWTETIQAADVYCYNTNKTLYFPNGVYKCDDGIIKRAKWEGEQVCQIGVFPLYDDKVNMVGDKSGLRGTAILF